jgi:hypothetical protein
MILGLLDQLFQILDQIVQLRHLDVVLDHIARIEEANGHHVLLDCLIVLLLIEKLVGVLLDDLALDLPREVGILCNGQGFLVLILLHQVVNLDIVFHFVQLDQFSLEPSIDHILRQIVNGVVLHLEAPMQDVAISGGPKQRDFVFEVINGKL